MVDLKGVKNGDKVVFGNGEEAIVKLIYERGNAESYLVTFTEVIENPYGGMAYDSYYYDNNGVWLRTDISECCPLDIVAITDTGGLSRFLRKHNL